MNERDDLVFVEHILDSIKDIEKFSLGLTRERLSSNRLKQNAIVRSIEIIGEATKNISEYTKNKNKEIKWKEIIGTRDKMIHHYFGVDLNVVWRIIKEDIPMLKKQILEIKEKELNKKP